jgi:hypothetical protein
MSEEVSDGEKLDENPSGRSRIVSCEEKDRQTDRQKHTQTEMKEIIVANGPKKGQLKKPGYP